MPSSADLKLYDSTDTTENPTLSFTTVLNGTPSAAQTLHLWNDKGLVLNADTAEDVKVTAYSGASGSGLYSQEHALAANRWIEIRAVGVTGTGIGAQTTPWTPIGKGADLALASIPKNAARYLEVRVNVPAGAGTQAGDVIVRASDGTVVTVLGDGHYEGQQGVLAGVGDAGVSELLLGGVLTESGAPDANLNVSTAVWVGDGEPRVKVAHAVATNGNDSAAAALIAGESYPITASLAPAGTVTITKGVKATAPLDPTAYPATPDGEVFLGHVERPFSAVITNSLIDQTGVRYGGFRLAYSASSPDVTVSGGRAMVSNRKIQMGLGISLTLALSDDTWIWLTPNGQFETNLTGVAPIDRSLALWKVTTDGTGVTVVVDLRTWTAPNLLHVPFAQRGTLADGDYTYAVLPGGAPWYVLPLSGVQMGLGDEGSVSGSTLGDIEYLSAPAVPTWTTLFTSQGTVDLRPSLAHDAAKNWTDAAFPEVLKLNGGTMLRWKVVTTATTPKDLFGWLRVAQAGV